MFAVVKSVLMLKMDVVIAFLEFCKQEYGFWMANTLVTTFWGSAYLI